MNKIRFSHEYEKMPIGCVRPGLTKILEIFTAERKDLSDDFLRYDTEIKTYQDPKSDIIVPREYYELPKGKVIIILLLTITPRETALWTTIRRWEPEKEKYYRSIRGQYIEIVIEEEK